MPSRQTIAVGSLVVLGCAALAFVLMGRDTASYRIVSDRFGEADCVDVDSGSTDQGFSIWPDSTDGLSTHADTNAACRRAKGVFGPREWPAQNAERTGEWPRAGSWEDRTWTPVKVKLTTRYSGRVLRYCVEAPRPDSNGMGYTVELALGDEDDPARFWLRKDDHNDDDVQRAFVDINPEYGAGRTFRTCGRRGMPRETYQELNRAAVRLIVWICCWQSHPGRWDALRDR